MAKCLLDVACRSDKRKGLLLYLLEGSHTLEDIKKNLHVTSTGMLPQIKILRENGFVEQEGDCYKLSMLGKVAANRLKSFLNIAGTFDQNYEYWSTRDLSSIPAEFQRKLAMLGEYEILNPDIDHLFEPPQKVLDSLSSSKAVYSVTSHFHPVYLSLFKKYAEEGQNPNLVITKTVLSTIREKCPEALASLIGFSSFYLSDIPVSFLGLLYSEKFMTFTLLNTNKQYDHLMLFSQSPSAISWGKELFDYFKSHSHEITEKECE